MARRRSRRPAQTKMQRVVSRYDQWEDNVDLNALAEGGDISGQLLDRSTLIADTPIRLIKATMYWWNQGMDDGRPLLVAIIRQAEGTAAPNLQDEAVVRDLRENGQILRGPWIIKTIPDARAGSVFASSYKTVVLKNVNVGLNDDIDVCFTNVGPVFAATAQTIEWFTKVFWRTV